MTREDAYYERIRLLCGYWDNYEDWLNTYLETENPLSDIVLKLVDCGDDMKEVERALNLYCLEKAFDEESVYKMMRKELCDNYQNGVITKDEVASALFRFSQNIPDCYFQNCCGALSDYYELAQLGILDMKKFDAVLGRWLDNGCKFVMDEMMR